MKSLVTMMKRSTKNIGAEYSKDQIFFLLTQCAPYTVIQDNTKVDELK